MKKCSKKEMKRFAAVCLAGMMVFSISACGEKKEESSNLVTSRKEEKR